MKKLAARCAELPGAGRLGQLHILGVWEPRMRQWIANHHTLKEIRIAWLDLYWEKVRRRYRKAKW